MDKMGIGLGCWSMISTHPAPYRNSKLGCPTGRAAGMILKGLNRFLETGN